MLLFLLSFLLFAQASLIFALLCTAPNLNANFTVGISKNTLTQSPTPLKELEGGKNSEGNLFLFQTNKVDSLLVRLHINGSLSLTNLAMSISSGCLEGATCKIWLCALDTWENNYLCMYSKKSQILTSSGHRNKTILSH